MSQHITSWEQIPWLVNGTLQGKELEQLRLHLSRCDSCRHELERQTLMRDAVASQPTVEFAPQASFNKLWARIENEATCVPASSARSGQRRWIWWAMAAQWLLMVGGVGTYLYLAAPEYRTVSRPSTVPAGELKVVFDQGATVAEVSVVLKQAGLLSLSGPTQAGVFVLGRDAEHASSDIDALVAQLRADPRVRFAERSTARSAE